MFVLPKGTLVHFRGMPFRLLADAETDGLQAHYDLALNQGPATSMEQSSDHAAACATGLSPELCSCKDARTVGDFGARQPSQSSPQWGRSAC